MIGEDAYLCDTGDLFSIFPFSLIKSLLPELRRGETDHFLERPRKIAHIAKAGRLGDVTDGARGLGKLAAGVGNSQ